MKRINLKKLFVSALAVSLMTGAMSMASGTAYAAQDCDSNAIIYCGATSPKQFVDKAKANDKGDLPAIYQDFGLAPDEYQQFATNAKMGTAYKDGRIVVDGRTVATDAWSIGREKNGKSYKWDVKINGKTYYGSKNQDVFRGNSIPVMVMFDNTGTMKFAALTACGNPITGKKVTPNYSCDLLTKTPVAGKADTYRFNTKASAANGAKVTKVVYDFGDGNSRTVTGLSTVVEHTYAKPGTYTAKVTVHTSLPGNQNVTVTSSKCATQITVPAPEKPEVPETPKIPETPKTPEAPVCATNPQLPVDSPDCGPCATNPELLKNDTGCGTGEDAPTELPSTGAGSILALFAGTSAIGTFGYRWFMRRKLMA